MYEDKNTEKIIVTNQEEVFTYERSLSLPSSSHTGLQKETDILMTE